MEPAAGDAGPAATEQVQQLDAVVHGFVQGVNFRHYTRRQARSLRLTGYVQNLPDGTVYVVAQGNRGALAELLAWLRRGPGLAEVSSVDVTWGKVGERAVGFEVRY
jgi:acylphosphatase